VRRSRPQLVETRQQKAGVARWVADLGGWWDETDLHIPYFTKDRMRTNCDIGISGVVRCLTGVLSSSKRSSSFSAARGRPCHSSPSTAMPPV
jgi:hypothetical protein